MISSKPLFLGSCVMFHLRTKGQSIFQFIEISLFAGMIQQHVHYLCKHFTPVPLSGSRMNCSIFETISSESFVCL